MQLSNRSGIACDQCGLVCQTDFEYYSADFKLINVFNNRMPSLASMLNAKTTHSLDLCPSCYNVLKKKIVENYASIMNKPKTVICELTGAALSGTFDCYYGIIAEVSVRMSGQTSVCTKCKTKTNKSQDKCEKCGGSQFNRPASVHATHRVVEFVVSESELKRMLDHSKHLRSLPANEWTTKS